MTIIRAPRTSGNFTIIQNNVLQDERLSMRALGLLVRLLSRPDNWATNSQTLAREFNCGREQMQGTLSELRQAGYLSLIKTRNPLGHIRSEWHVSEVAETGVTGACDPEPGNPYPGASGALQRTDLQRTDTNPQPPEGAVPVVPKKAKKPRTKKEETSLQTWLEAVKAAGEKAIPADDPILAEAVKMGVPGDFMLLAWAEFKQRYSREGAKRYKDWRATFRDAIRRNYMKLWYFNAQGECALTTAGEQAKRLQKEAA